MSQETFTATIPTNTFEVQYEEIDGGWKVTFRWYPQNSFGIECKPCTGCPSVTTTPNGSGGTNITITWDNGQSQFGKNNLVQALSPAKPTAKKRVALNGTSKP